MLKFFPEEAETLLYIMERAQAGPRWAQSLLTFIKQKCQNSSQRRRRALVFTELPL